MFKKRRLNFMVLLLSLFLVTTISSKVLAYSTDIHKWPSSSISYKIDSSVPFNYSGATSTAVSWWSDKTDVYLYSSSSSPCTVYAYDYGYTSWDGQTTRSSTGSTYTKADLQLNRYWTDSYAANNNLELKLVVAHEFGHVLGLNHVFSYTMMYSGDVWVAYLNNSDLQYGPVYDDVAGVNAIY